MDIEKQLFTIHSKLRLMTGNLRDEKNEQLMSVKYIKPDDVVLEIGGNIGRNSLVIASLLDNPSNLVVLESDPASSGILKKHSEINKLPFLIEDSALSQHPLIQKGWNTKIGTEESGWFKVKTITWEDLKKKYPLNYNVLVADCEGALYHILQSYPEIIEGIKTILLENDFYEKDQALWVHDFLKSKGFVVDYSTNGGGGGWGYCKEFFWQTWLYMPSEDSEEYALAAQQLSNT